MSKWRYDPFTDSCKRVEEPGCGCYVFLVVAYIAVSIIESAGIGVFIGIVIVLAVIVYVLGVEKSLLIGGLIFLILIVAVAFSDYKPNTANKTTETDYVVDYWNGDLNSPIFIKRNDDSMVTFKKDSARISDKTYENGNELVVFRGCEVEANGTFVEYGYYGIFFDEGKNYYYVCYPKTKHFPEGKQIDIKNQSQQSVCKFMVKAGRDNGTIHID